MRVMRRFFPHPGPLPEGEGMYIYGLYCLFRGFFADIRNASGEEQ